MSKQINIGLYFQNRKHEVFLVKDYGNVDIDLFEIVSNTELAKRTHGDMVRDIKARNKDYVIAYTRCWKRHENVYCFDFGSYSEFYLLGDKDFIENEYTLGF